MNPLQLIPAKGRATVYIMAAIIGVAVPFLIPDVPTIWQHVLGAIIAISALFGGGQGLSNLVPDHLNPAILEHQVRAIADTGEVATGTDVTITETETIAETGV